MAKLAIAQRLGELDQNLRLGRHANQRPPYWHLRNHLRQRLNVMANRRFAGHDRHPPQFIGFVQRSGSTWLLELLSTQPNIIPIADPLLARNLPPNQLPRWLLTPQDLAQAQPHLARTVNFTKCAVTISQPQLAQPSRPLRHVVNLANAHWVLPELAASYQRKPFFLLRHPIDVARSQLNHWNMPLQLPTQLPRLQAAGLLSPRALKILTALVATNDPFKHRMAEIFAELAPVLKQPEQFHLIYYEDLRQGRFDALKLFDKNFTPPAKTVINSPSKTTQANNTLTNGVSKHCDREHRQGVRAAPQQSH